ncbi:hypothetical protein CGI05_24530, partial [Vibrio parahaemolyticus]|uniref:hypothetical protein n=1 Tax=Vibrio parahaemolyticus TaxID=670 RepID=UPI00117501FA
EGNSRISIDVVVNDDEMTDEADVSDIYGEREHLDFDIEIEVLALAVDIRHVRLVGHLVVVDDDVDADSGVTF